MTTRRSRVPLALLALAAIPLVACGGGGGHSSTSTPGTGFVGQLTGDPDDEVSATLQDQVARALERDENDVPIPD